MERDRANAREDTLGFRGHANTVRLVNEPALVGVQLFTQALVLGPTLALCNAMDLVLGT